MNMRIHLMNNKIIPDLFFVRILNIRCILLKSKEAVLYLLSLPYAVIPINCENNKNIYSKEINS